MEFNRRMWLRGAAGFTLALPFLPSLVSPRTASAGGAATRKRFIAMGVDHGAVRHENMTPDASKLTESMSYAGQKIWRGNLADQLKVSGGVASLSPVLSADSGRFTKTLVNKMNVLRGLDVTFYLGHNRGGHLGNFADNDGNLNNEQGITHMPTIDQVLAWSKTFYPSLDTIRERSLQPGVYYGDQKLSWGYSSPSTQSGDMQPVGVEFDSLALFNKIFVPPADPGKTHKPIVDHVFDDYKRLRDGNRRLSAADKQRLGDYMDRMGELQRKLKVQASCTDIKVPGKSTTQVLKDNLADFGSNPAANREGWQLVNDVIVAAFSCDTSRIAAMHIGDTELFSTYAGDWHHQVAHEAAGLADPVPQSTMTASRQKIFEGVFLDLMAKLDAVPEPEGTLLDSTLLQWTQECGPSTHTPMDLPVITAGGAGGFFRTGQCVDYRNRDVVTSKDGEGSIGLCAGLVYNQWLGTVLQSMGLAPSEYESGGNGGYGAIKLATEGWYPGTGKYDQQLKVMSDVLPFLKKA